MERLDSQSRIRSLLKKCFKFPIFSFVPFEIWKDLIVSTADAESIALISQTCHAFKEVVDYIGERNFNLALILRREGQIDFAKKFLYKCGNNNDLKATLHLGLGHGFGDWGLEKDEEKGAEWLKKSAELGNYHAMAYFSIILLSGEGVERNEELSNVWARKALSSNDSFAVGYCHFFGLNTNEDYEQAFPCFEASAKEGSEFGQDFLGYCFHNGFGTQVNREKGFHWQMQAAIQGRCEAQHDVGQLYLNGRGCEIDKEKAIVWFKKAAKQGNKFSKDALKGMGIEI